jgi:hypothetical protein
MKKRAGARIVLALTMTMALVASACGDDSSDDAEASAGGDGGSVKVGILHSLSGTMSISEVADMPNNDVCPDVRVDPDTFAVTIDGDLIEAEPATELPMAQRYFLF